MEEKQELTETANENEQPKTFDVLIEEKRAPLYKKFLVSKKISNYLTIAILIIAIFGMYLVTGSEIWMPILGYSLLGVGVIAMFLYYFLSKKTFDQSTKDYIEFVNESLNKETFENKKFSNITVTETKVEINDVANNGVYKDIVRVASRNVISGKYDNNDFNYAEIAIFKSVGNAKKQSATAAFVGKYFEIINSIKFDGNIVINISKEEPVDVINAVDEKKVLYDQDGVAVYGDEGTDFRKVLGEEFFGTFKKIKAENHLLNLAISIWEGHTFVYMSYDDDVIALPFDKKFNVEAFRSFVEDLNKTFAAVNLLGK